MATYLTLYFIPLFETAHHDDYIKCGQCNGQFKPAVLDYKPPSQAERVLHSIRADLENGTPVQMARTKLLNGGAEAELVEMLVTVAAGEKQVHCGTCNLSFVESVTRCSGCGGELGGSQANSSMCRFLERAMPTERSIPAAELTGRLDEVLEEIRRSGVIYLIDLGPATEEPFVPYGMVDRDDHIRFVLVPCDVCRAAGPWDDLEYGWPYVVRAEDVRTAADLAPGYRRHPMIFREGKYVAASVMIGEYEAIKDSLRGSHS